MPSLSLSVNQLTAETRKAALGKGASYGMADDITRAVEWLAHHGHVPSGELSRYLCAPTEAQPKAPQIADNAINITGKIGLADVAVGLDYLEAFARPALSLTDMLYPCLSLALAHLRQSPMFGSFTDEAGQTLDVICTNQANMPTDITLQLQAFISQDALPYPARVMIDASAYQLLQQSAHHTYVPSSDSSRKAGAGAGLNDND